MEKTCWMLTNDDVSVYVKKWFNPSKRPKAIIQLAHGMVEHIERYNDFAEFLVESDFVVYGNDHRGHGKTGEKQGLMGYLADEEGFVKTTSDLFELTRRIKNAHPDTPIFLLGHSMGSFLARHYIQEDTSLIKGVILSGTGFYPKATSVLAKRLASFLSPKEKSNLMNTLAFYAYNKRVKDPKTNFDWLTRDDAVIQSYMNDPYCSYIPTAGFFCDLMDGITTIHNQKQNKAIRSDLPMLIVSGTHDPVGDYEKGVWKTAQLYDDAGLRNVVTMLFDEARHEVLNETNHTEVYAAIRDWIMVHNV